MKKHLFPLMNLAAGVGLGLLCLGCGSEQQQSRPKPADSTIEESAAERAVTARTGAGWHDPARAQKVLKLIPGRKIGKLTPETLFADWTKQQVERWQKSHPGQTIESVCEAATAGTPALPSDRDLTEEFPVHISPMGRLHSGVPDDPWKSEWIFAGVQIGSGLPGYCPFCESRGMKIEWDKTNAHHARTICCHRDLYEREKDYPAGYDLKPNLDVEFLHLDGTVRKASAVLYKDRRGVEWELFIPTLFAIRRWEDSIGLTVSYLDKFKETADPAYAYKLAVLLDKTADTYYGLPLSYVNKLAVGKDGKALTREEWEAVPRPSVFGPSYLGPWNRRVPYINQGWLRQCNEAVWAEPFARVRRHPAFRYYSQKVYGDPEALDRKVRQKLMREIALTWEAVSVTGLLTDYQDAIYTSELLLAVLAERPALLDFAAPGNELTLYNHHYHDGLCGEGAANYIGHLRGYYYPPLCDPKGSWLEICPEFLKDHPFLKVASAESQKLRTVRGLELEFGDEHIYAYNTYAYNTWLTNAAKVKECEATPSRNWPGWGLGILRVGGAGHRQEVTLSYTRVAQHTASDPLGIACWVDGVPVMRPGGYASGGLLVPLQFDRPEMQGLKKMGYPKEIVDAQPWSWDWVHSPVAQNTVMVNDTFPSAGWQDQRGYGELIAFKGGEGAGEPGARFQVIEARDRCSFERVGVPVGEFRRALLGVEGPDGRPYVVDLVTLRGGQRHALFNSAWAERGEVNLPPVADRQDNLLRLLKPAAGIDEGAQSIRDRTLERVRSCAVLAAPQNSWDITWRTDYAAYAPRDPKGAPFVRPLPEDTGKVRLRFIGLPLPGQDRTLVSAKGPWVAIIAQPLNNGQALYSNVGFLDATDFLIETRRSDKGETASRFVHLLEGYREGESSVIKSVRFLPLKSGLRHDGVATATQAGDVGEAVAIEVIRMDGVVDVIIYQTATNALELSNGMATDARYALVRFGSDGQPRDTHMVEGGYLRGQGIDLSGQPRFTGTIVDLIGDLTGTRQESALIVRPDAPWPTAVPAGCGHVIVEGPNALRAPFREAYALERISVQQDGTVRLNLSQAAPLAVGWHQVMELDPNRPDFFRTNRPMLAGSETPWYRGMTVWFPRLNKTYRFKTLAGGLHMCTEAVLDGNVNLAADGIKTGDWFVIHFLEPGMKVSLPNALVWVK